MPHSEFEKDGKLKIVIAGLDKNVRNQAVVAANERLNAETNEKGFKGFIRGRVWKGNLARERYLEKYKQEAEAEIRENDNLLQHEDRSDEAARVATTLRYASEFEDEVIHEGETRKNIETDSSPEAEEIKVAVKDLIKQYATGSLDDDSFEEEKRRTMTELAESGVSQNYIGEGLMYADNLLQIAQNVKAAIDHGKSIDELLENAEFVVGEARMGARTEARLSGTERIMKKLEGKAFVHEATVATAVSIAYSIGGWAAKTALGAAGRLAIPGIGAGLIAAARENRVLKEERALHMREMAEGKEFDPKAPGNKRREKLEGTRYETKGANSMIDQLGVLYDDEGNLRIEGDRTRFDEAMAMVAEIQARIQLSDREKLDLIDFSAPEKIETERFNLDVALAKAKVDLRHLIEGADDPTLTALGIQPADIQRLKAEDGDVIPFVLDSRVEAAEGILSDEISDRNRVFNKFRRGHLAGTFVTGTVLGVTLGLGAQEFMALADSNTTGVLESVFAGDQQGGATHETFLASAFGGGGGGEHAETILSGAHGSPVELSDGTKLTLPPEFHTQIIDGKLNIMGGDGSALPALHDLPLNPDGSLSPIATEALNSNGFHLASTHDVISHPVSTPETVSAEQFHQAHQDLATHVTRDFWYDHGTPRVFEREELQLDLNYDADGNIVFDVSRMHLSPEQLQHMQMAVSETSKLQHEPFMLKFNDHGQAPVDKDLQGMFHKGPDGTPVFDGKYAEASEVAGTDANGVTHIRPLATVVGEGHSSFTDTVTHTETQPVTSHVVDYNAPAGPETVVDVPPVIPVYARRGLGEVTNPETPPVTPTPENGYIAGYGYYGSPEAGSPRWLKWDKERSPRMREDPGAELNTGEELAWYREQQGDSRGQEYLDEVDGYIDQNESLRNLGPEIKAMVCIPVAAAAESENIYNTLSLYAQQDPESRDATAIVLNLNWLERLESDPDAVAKMDKTRSEIARAQADFPELKISVFEKVWTEDFVNERNGRIYGEVIKVLYDTAALAMERSVREGRRASTDEAVLITNDADVKGMSSRYLENYIRAMERETESDVFTGSIRWGSDTFKDFPGYGVSSSFYAIVNMMYQRGERRSQGFVSTTGPNAGMRMSAFAAVGGCEDSPDMGAGADAVLGQRIAAARRAEPAPTSGGASGSTTASSGGTPEGAATPPRGPGRKVGHHVGGAQVDTFADRLLGAYRRGEWMAAGWNGFDSGGYQDRSVSAGRGASGPEDPAVDIDTVAARVETNILGFANGWFRDQGVVNEALAFTFGKRNSAGEDLYNANWNSNKFEFSFTDAGRRELQRMLTQSPSGKFDPFGERIRRQLYESGRLVEPRNATGTRTGTQTPVPTPPIPTPPVPPVPPVPVSYGAPGPETSGGNPEAQRRLELLNTVPEGTTVTSYLGNTHNYSGPMQLLTHTPGGDYVFGVVDSTTGDVDDADMVILNEDELVRFMRSGLVSVPPPAAI
jgi:hypothetical protein